jgi:hypothetical protein
MTPTLAPPKPRPALRPPFTEPLGILRAVGSAQVAEAQEQNSPGTAEQSGAEHEWATVNNIKVDDASYATVTLGASSGEKLELSNVLIARNYGFALPEGATVLGLSPFIKRKASAYSPPYGAQIFDYEVQVIKGGEALPGEGLTPGGWATSDTVKTYGGSSELFGGTWTAADINAPDFGWQIQVVCQGGTGTTASVAHMGMVVYYTEAADENRICFAGRSIELRSDGVYRQAPEDDGWGLIVPKGFLPTASPSGLEERASRFIIVPSQGDLGELADSGDNALEAQSFVRPGYLYSREASEE